MPSSSIENRLDRIEKSLVHIADKSDIEQLESKVFGQRVREDDEQEYGNSET